MDVYQARLTGTVEEWQQLNKSNGRQPLAYIHRAAQLLANDLVQLLETNKEVQAYFLEGSNRLALSLSLALELDVPAKKEDST